MFENQIAEPIPEKTKKIFFIETRFHANSTSLKHRFTCMDKLHMMATIRKRLGIFIFNLILLYFFHWFIIWLNWIRESTFFLVIVTWMKSFLLTQVPSEWISMYVSQSQSVDTNKNTMLNTSKRISLIDMAGEFYLNWVSYIFEYITEVKTYQHRQFFGQWWNFMAVIQFSGPVIQRRVKCQLIVNWLIIKA